MMSDKKEHTHKTHPCGVIAAWRWPGSLLRAAEGMGPMKPGNLPFGKVPNPTGGLPLEDEDGGDSILVGSFLYYGFL